MTLAVGMRLGPYEILSALGAGGMGEVYRATDTRLKRQVAIKVLPAALTSDPDRLARFQREAEVLASINHPNIAAIYGIEDAGGTKALILELVEGPTLADRIALGPIPLDEVLPMARQITDALEFAHEQGIVHRDLKPANIKVRPDGTLKVLDFGLAKAGEPMAASNTNIAAAPTITSPALMTGAGVILGTAAYMSPEQAKGRPADARSDVWAFGCVLYEMLTGKRPFGGEDVADTLAAVLRAEPDWTALPPNTPRAVRRLLERCLRKDRRRRLAAIADARLELDEATSPDVTPRPGLSRTVWVAAGLAIVALIFTGVFAFRTIANGRRATDPLQPFQFSIAPPQNETFGGPPAGGTGNEAQVAISPDGRHIVFVAGAQGKYHLWLRPLAALAATPIPGTEGAAFPFWSADGQSIGFFAGSKLKSVKIAGGPPMVLCDAPAGRGGTWSRDNVILFTPSSAGSGLQRVSSKGGTPVDVTTLDPSSGETSHRWPHFLPDGRHFFYTATTGVCCPATKPAVVRLGSLDRTEATIALLQAESSVFYASGHLFFARGDVAQTMETTLMAQPFDADTRQLKGEAFPVAEHVGFEGSRYITASASDSGTLVYGQSPSQATQQQLTWFDREGRALGGLGEPTPYESLALSPDEHRLAVSLRSGSPPNPELWLFNVATGNKNRLTVNPGFDRSPVWSPDGTRLAFTSERSGKVSLRQMSIDGALDEALAETPNIVAGTSWSSDGRYIAFTVGGPSGSVDIWALPTFGSRQAFAVAQTRSNETGAVFSPDVRWIAFTSNETGLSEVYVQPFPGPGARRPVSKQGGRNAAWRADGKELFYIALDGTLMAVPADSTGRLDAGASQALFFTGTMVFGSGQVYAATKNGQRFLINGRPQQSTSTPLAVVVNWRAALRN